MSKWQERVNREDVLKRVTVRRVISIFQTTKPIKHFQIDLYFKLVEMIVGCTDIKLAIRLLEGTEIELEAE